MNDCDLFWRELQSARADSHLTVRELADLSAIPEARLWLLVDEHRAPTEVLSATEVAHLVDALGDPAPLVAVADLLLATGTLRVRRTEPEVTTVWRV